MRKSNNQSPVMEKVRHRSQMRSIRDVTNMRVSKGRKSPMSHIGKSSLANSAERSIVIPRRSIQINKLNQARLSLTSKASVANKSSFFDRNSQLPDIESEGSCIEVTAIGITSSGLRSKSISWRRANLMDQSYSNRFMPLN